MFTKLANIFKPSLSPETVFHHVDLHSHLLPAIDDGVKSFDESIAIIKQLKELGFKKLITTPHIMHHRFPNTQEKILKVYDQLQIEIQKASIDIEIDVAAEYYYDEYFLELIDKKTLMSFGKENYILFELSYTVKPFMLEQAVAKLLAAGYRPILAHPERYTYYKTLDDYMRVKDMGLLFQINAISLGGFYGKNVKKSVEMLVNAGLVDFIGSDIHSQKYVDAFSAVLKSSIYRRVFDINKIKNNTLKSIL